MITVQGMVKKTISIINYIGQLSGGIAFLFSSKGIAFFYIGSTLIWAANYAIWGNLMLFPFYQGYSGSDELTGLLRAIIFFTGVFWQLIIIKIITKIKRVGFWIFIGTTVANPIFFSLAMIYYILVPPHGFELSTFIGVIIIFQSVSILENLENILRARLNVDLVKDTQRNTVYSLLPTIVTFLGIPLSIFGGQVLSIYGESSGFIALILICLVGVILVGMGLIWLEKRPEKFVLAKKFPEEPVLATESI